MQLLTNEEPSEPEGKEGDLPSIVTQPMMQHQLNRTELRSTDSCIQILCRFQKSQQKVPPPSLPCITFVIMPKELILATTTTGFLNFPTALMNAIQRQIIPCQPQTININTYYCSNDLHKKLNQV